MTRSRIVELRKARGWTQAKLAESAGLSASAIAMYETNRRVPDNTAMEKLARALGVSPEMILERLEEATDTVRVEKAQDTVWEAGGTREGNGNGSLPCASRGKGTATTELKDSRMVEGSQETAKDTRNRPKVLLNASAETVNTTAKTPNSPKETASTPVERLDTRKGAASTPVEERAGGQGAGTTTLTLTASEAKLILFTRLNPAAMPFFHEYMTASPAKREQMERSLRLVQQFQI